MRRAYETVEAESKPKWEAAVRDPKDDRFGDPDSPDIVPDFGKEPIFLDLANNPKIIPLIAPIVGPTYQTMGIACNNHPAYSDAHTVWHTGLANRSDRDRRMIVYAYTQFFVKNWESITPSPDVVAWAGTPQKRQLTGIHSIGGRWIWDRQEVPYLLEQEAVAKAKRL